MSVEKILVVGGAGYIGSHAAKWLHKHGYVPVVYDNLSRGNADSVKWGELIVGDIADGAALDRVFKTHDISSVMHFAAFAYVGESTQEPALYYENNVGGTLSLLNSMVKNGVKKMVFSSTCSIFGDQDEFPIDEGFSQNPMNPYAHSKQMIEQILDDYSRAYSLNSVSLRYFNAAGADPDGEIGEVHKPETHLIPIILDIALGKREVLEVYGNDYNTPDGTCIRDYIHIMDLANAHMLSHEYLKEHNSNAQFNLGNGQGFSIEQVVAACEKVTGKPVPKKYIARREGDPPVLIGNNELARKKLNWIPQFATLEEIIETAWKWHSARFG